MWFDEQVKHHYYRAYTLLFATCALIVFSTHIACGQGLVWGGDGMAQHFNALVYYGKWLRKLARFVITLGAAELPFWDFSFGYGSDVVATLGYYVIGDPLALLSAVVPARYTEYLYAALIIVRLYLAGFAFSAFCRKMGAHPTGTLAGALAYAFCGWVLFACTRHPFFANPMIYLPLLLIGFEKIMRRESPIPFVLAVAVSVASNFYFCYMLVLALLIYAVFRFFTFYRSRRALREGVAAERGGWEEERLPERDGKGRLAEGGGEEEILAEDDGEERDSAEIAGKEGILADSGNGQSRTAGLYDPPTSGEPRSLRAFALLFGKCLGLGVIGALMACAVLVPVLIFFMDASRASGETAYLPLFSLDFYRHFVAAFTSIEVSYTFDTWTAIGLSAPVLPGAFALFALRKRRTALKLALVLATLCLMIPAVSSIFNGFSYPANRWTFIYDFLFCFAFVAAWPELSALSRRGRLAVVLGSAAYIALVAVTGQMEVPEAASCVLLVLALALALAASVRGSAAQPKTLLFTRAFSVLFVVLVMVGAGVNAHCLYAPDCEDYASGFEPAGTAYSTMQGTKAYKFATTQKADKEFNRLDTTTFGVKNTSINAGSHLTQYYWSLANGAVCSYMKDMGLTHIQQVDNFSHLESRAAMEALASVRYFSAAKERAPFGFKLDKKLSNDEYEVYVNQNALPLGYTYDSYVTVSEWMALDLAQRQQVLLQSAVIPDEDASALPEGVGHAQAGSPEGVQFDEVSLDYTVEAGKNAEVLADGSFLATEKNAKVTVRFAGLKNCETYLQFEGLNAQQRSRLDLYLDDDDELYPRAEYDALTEQERRKLQEEDDALASDPYEVYSIGVKTSRYEQNIRYTNAYYRWTSGQTDFLVNLGYGKDALKSVTITLPRRAVYSFDDLKVICQPMEHFTERVDALRADVMENEKVGVNRVSGTVSLAQGKVLCLSIPYARGWSATVDGQPAKLIRTNDMFTGVPIAAGDHDVVLTYETPGLKPGIIASLVGLIAFVVLCFIWRKRPSDTSLKPYSNSKTHY